MKKLLAELRTFLGSLAADLRRRRDYRNLLEVEALQDIQTDLAGSARRCADTAFRARALDDEGLQLLRQITAPDSPGGALIVRAELPKLRRAMRCIGRSSALDHDLAEDLHPAPEVRSTGLPPPAHA